MTDVSRVPAPDPADTLDFFIAAPISEHDAVATQKARAALTALLAGRRQDKERIERLEEAAREYVDAVSADDAAVERLIQENDADGTLGRVQALTAANCAAAFVALAAALAGEEDTP